MPRNASGTYTLPSGNPVVSGTLIDATWANNTLSDLGNEVTDSLSRSGEGAMLAPLRITDGVQATPSLAFSNEPSSGLYRAGSNEWWAVAAGVQNLRFTNTGLTTRAAAGAVGTPSIAAFNDTDTGIYFPGANELAIATGGAARMTFDSAGAVAVPGTFTLSGGTANGVLYLNGSKVATSGSALTFDSTQMDIGVGGYYGRLNLARSSGSPYATMTLTDPSNVANEVGIYLRANGTNPVGISSAGAPVAFYLGGPGTTEAMRLTTTGLGIGTASPGSKLHVVQTAASEGLRIDGDGSGYAFVVNGGTDRTSRIRALSIGAAYVSTTPPTNGLIVDGNLGIGTASPSYRLQVQSAGTGTTAASNIVGRFQTNGSGYDVFVQLSDNVANSGGIGMVGGAMYLANGTTRNLTLDSSGNLGLGVTPSAWVNATASQVGFGAAISSRGAGNTASDMTHAAYWNGTNWLYQSSSVGAARYQMTGANAGSTHAWFVSAGGTAGNTITFTQAMTLDSSGNLGVGATSPSATFRATVQGVGTSGNPMGGILFRQGATDVFSISPISTDNTTDVEFWNYQNGYMRFGTNNTERGRFSAGGDLLVGATSGSYHVIRKAVTTDAGNITVEFQGSSGGATSQIWYGVSGYGANAANAATKVGRDATTTRSINAGGTVNASGADYAEYMTKAGEFVLAKGDVCGINADGKLTNVFADAVSFVVKSTDPSYVGGDSWGADFNDDPEGFETARQKVDRIAFAGQVPVNVLGATPGQYIVPVNDNGAIKGIAVSTPTFEQYQSAVGKVIAVQDDGRALIIVKVA